MRALYIAKGELWLQRGSGSPQRIESKFAQDVVARDEQSRRAGGWKNAPREEQRGVIPNSMHIADDGSVIYSNGFELLRAAGSQPKATLGRADLVETVSLA